MKKIFATLLLACLALPAFGCECRGGPIDDKAAQQASQVFIFRLLSAELQATPKGTGGDPYVALGRIAVVDTLRGDASRFRQVRFSTYSCCGMRLNVGQYYYAFVSGKGSTFEANEGTILETRYTYYGGKKDDLRAEVENLLLHGKGLSEQEWEDSWMHTQVIQPSMSAVSKAHHDVCPRK